MDLRQLRYFVTLFEEGSVTKAARRLGVVQPALSMQIRKLEEEFHTQLFLRTSRGVDPTFAGEAFYKKATAILDEIRSAEAYLRDSSKEVAGDLAVGLMPSLSISALAPAVAEFNKTYPSVKIRVIEAYSDYLIENLEKQIVDFAIINDDGNAGDAELVPLYTDSLVYVTAETESCEAVSLKDIQGPSLVLPSMRQGMRRTLDRQFSRMDLAASPRIRIDSLNGVLGLVASGGFSTVLPSLAVRHLVAEGKVSIRPIEPEISHNVVVAYSPKHPPTLAGRILIDVIKKIVLKMLGNRAEVPETFHLKLDGDAGTIA